MALRGTAAPTGWGGGTAPAALRSLRNANLPETSLTGIGSTLINVVNLKDFNLVNGGRINLTGGVHTLFLNAIGSDTQVNLRELPEQALSSSGTTSVTQNGV